MCAMLDKKKNYFLKSFLKGQGVVLGKICWLGLIFFLFLLLVIFVVGLIFLDLYILF